MLTRRHLLGTIALATTVGASVAVRPTSARAIPDLDPVLSGRFVEDRALFFRMRGLSGTLLDLRLGYTGPFGYERGAWRRRALDAWRQAYGQTPDAGFATAQREVPAFLLRADGRWFGDAASETVQRTAAGFADWTTRIGIREDSRLYEDMILAQGAMALLLSMRTPEARAARTLAVFDGLTWIWPFCGG
ncbi:hypothetical protein [Stappia stellulata]|uniref:hypothetical protein n=1 Tax=Stappia stellulata TaxID=71235 RepID=UPI00040AD64D|nr:hypothetical protein [Stappia stellulata]